MDASEADKRIMAHNQMMGMSFADQIALFQAWFNREHGGHIHASEFRIEPGPEFRYADRDVDLAWSAFDAACRMCQGRDADFVLAERAPVEVK